MGARIIQIDAASKREVRAERQEQPEAKGTAPFLQGAVPFASGRTEQRVDPILPLRQLEDRGQEQRPVVIGGTVLGEDLERAEHGTQQLVCLPAAASQDRIEPL